jgi:hypothetical protein
MCGSFFPLKPCVAEGVAGSTLLKALGLQFGWLAAASADRERFAADLSHAVREMGEEPTLDLHEGGILHKGWVDLEQRLRSTEQHLHSKDDAEIIRECIPGHSGSLSHYDHALAPDLDPICAS